MDEGHCGLPVEELVALTEKLLEVTAELVETALNLELEGGAVIADDLEGRRCVFLAALYRAELEIAEKLKTLAAGKPNWPSIDVDKAIPWVEQRTKLALAESQKTALRVALSSNVTVITLVIACHVNGASSTSNLSMRRRVSSRAITRIAIFRSFMATLMSGTISCRAAAGMTSDCSIGMPGALDWRRTISPT